eukprot:5171241-Pyramimonas_sp.AAC.1
MEVSDILKTEGKSASGHDAAVAEKLDGLLKYVSRHSSVLAALAQSDSKFLACDEAEMDAWILHWAGTIASFSNPEFEKGLAPKDAGLLRMQANLLSITDLRAKLGKKLRNTKGEGASDKPQLIKEFVQLEQDRSPSPQRVFDLLKSVAQQDCSTKALVAKIQSMKEYPNHVHLASPNF